MSSHSLNYYCNYDIYPPKTHQKGLKNLFSKSVSDDNIYDTINDLVEEKLESAEVVVVAVAPLCW